MARLLGAAAVSAVLVLAMMEVAGATGSAGTKISQPAGLFTRAQALRGKQVYAASCAACHADNLGGIGPALPLAGGTFQSKWANQTVFDLYERVRTTMPQSAPASLGDASYADVVAFLLRANNFPTGPVELTGNSPAAKAAPMTGGKP